jgi:hypothetical protein
MEPGFKVRQSHSRPSASIAISLGLQEGMWARNRNLGVLILLMLFGAMGLGEIILEESKKGGVEVSLRASQIFRG